MPPATIEIALQPFKVGELPFEPCDRLDEKTIAQLDEVHLRRMRHQRIIGELTRQTYQAYIKRRPNGTVGRGFTRAELMERGIIDDPEAPPEPEPEGLEGATPYKEFFYRTKKSGRFTLYDALNAKGELLRVQAFKNEERVKAFLDGLSTDSAS